MMLPCLVITGAPASGKTEFLARLRTDPAFSDFTFIDEIARDLLARHPDYRHDWRAFHGDVYREQLRREAAAAGRPFITDRGTADAFAFHPETAADVGTSIEAEFLRYSAVIQLGTAAALGPTCYITDNIRQESIAEALQIEAALVAVWKSHPHYGFLPATVDIEDKYIRFYELVTMLAGRRRRLNGIKDKSSP